MKTYELTQSGPITIEKSEDSTAFTFNAVKGTWFYGEWRDLTEKNLGELILEDGYCIPMCGKHLFKLKET
jgi:hypothetical protein